MDTAQSQGGFRVTGGPCGSALGSELACEGREWEERDEESGAKL